MEQEPFYENLIGFSVYKESKKPFKSGEKTNTVKAMINHPQLNIPAFTFEEDDSYVECRRCIKANECIINEKYICIHKEISGKICSACKLPDSRREKDSALLKALDIIEKL